MVSKQDAIRAKLATKVFNQIGKNVTFIKKLSPTYNSRGEIDIEGTQSTSTITIVPYNILYKEESHQPFGDLTLGDMDAAVPYTVSIDYKDEMTIESESYFVSSIERNYLPDNVVTIVRLTRKQA